MYLKCYFIIYEYVLHVRYDETRAVERIFKRHIIIMNTVPTPLFTFERYTQLFFKGGIHTAYVHNIYKRNGKLRNILRKIKDVTHVFMILKVLFNIRHYIVHT